MPGTRAVPMKLLSFTLSDSLIPVTEDLIRIGACGYFERSILALFVVGVGKFAKAVMHPYMHVYLSSRHHNVRNQRLGKFFFQISVFIVQCLFKPSGTAR